MEMRREGRTWIEISEATGVGLTLIQRRCQGRGNQPRSYKSGKMTDPSPDEIQRRAREIREKRFSDADVKDLSVPRDWSAVAWKEYLLYRAENCDERHQKEAERFRAAAERIEIPEEDEMDWDHLLRYAIES